MSRTCASFPSLKCILGVQAAVCWHHVVVCGDTGGVSTNLKHEPASVCWYKLSIVWIYSRGFQEHTSAVKIVLELQGSVQLRFAQIVCGLPGNSTPQVHRLVIACRSLKSMTFSSKSRKMAKAQFLDRWNGTQLCQAGLRVCLTTGEGAPVDNAFCESPADVYGLWLCRLRMQAASCKQAAWLFKHFRTRCLLSTQLLPVASFLFYDRYLHIVTAKRTAKDSALLVENSVKQVAWLSPTSTALGTASPLAVPWLI